MPRPVHLPDDWQRLDQKPMRGGQATAIPVEHKDGRHGVYRELKTQMSDVGKERFQRELEILSSKVQHNPLSPSMTGVLTMNTSGISVNLETSLASGGDTEGRNWTRIPTMSWNKQLMSFEIFHLLYPFAMKTG